MGEHCRLCGAGGDLDFHHWRYSDDTGCLLCRECHAHLHAPVGGRPGEGAGNDWMEVALPRLVERHLTHHAFIRTPQKIVQHYSLPEKYIPWVRELVTERT